MKGQWWQGARGEWYVAGQFALIGLVLFGPRRFSFVDLAVMPSPRGRLIFGGVLVAAGLLLAVAAALRLGKNLTPLPYPRRSGMLVQSGAYRLVRHPIYGGLVLAAFGWALVVGSWLTLAYAALLLLLLDAKASREERWLDAKHPEYSEYRRRVRKLIPFLR